MKSVELKFFNIYFVNLISRYVIQPHENNLTMNSLDLKSKNTKRLISISLVLMICFISTSLYAQRSVRIGYIDTEYILENINEYSIANTQLDTKVMEWKAEIEQRLTSLEDEKKKLTNERILLTNELVSEREEDLQIIENEIIDYQQKRFGPGGDLMIQKKQLIQPIQDQIFAAVQEIASSKKYDFIFDKSADVVMLYSADRYDISEQVLRTINRASKRTQAETKKERKEAEKETTIVEVDPGKSDRQKILDARKAEREALLEKKRQKKLEAKEIREKKSEAKKQKKLEERANKKEDPPETIVKDDDESSLQKKITVKEQQKKELGSEKLNPLEDPEKGKKEKNEKASESTVKDDDESSAEIKLTAKELRKKKLDERKKALEEKKKRLLKERKSRVEEQKRKRDSIKINK